MKVLLLQFVKNVGREGQVIDVADGLALNQLIPQKKAVAATKAIIAEYEHKKKGASEKEAHAKSEFMQQTAKIAGKTLVMKVQTNDKGVLYQSITPALIRTFLRDSQKVIVPEGSVTSKPIRDIGVYHINVQASGIQESFKLLIERA